MMRHKIFEYQVMISLEEYEKLKEYYDFQRKKEYNREQLEDVQSKT